MFRPEAFFSEADSRREIDLLERTVDFGKDDELNDLYYALGDDERLLVNEVLDKLTGDNDNWGYNFKMVSKKLRMPFYDLTDEGKESEKQKVYYNHIAHQLFRCRKVYWNKEVLKMWNNLLNDYVFKTDMSSAEFDETIAYYARTTVSKKLNDAYRSSYFEETANVTKEHLCNIEKAISEMKKLPLNEYDTHWQDIATRLAETILNTISKYDFAKIICECYCVDMDLVRYGIGKVYEISDLYYKDFFDTLADQDDFAEYCDNRSAATTIEMARAYEDYLKEDDALKDDQPVVITRWGVINQSGKYLMLKKKADDGSDTAKKELDAVRALIIGLLNL